MRKYLLAIIFPVILVLSGCSLTDSLGTSSTTNTGSFWKSADGGKTWTVKNKITEKTSLPTDTDILSLAINPKDPNNILFGTAQDGIYKTTDGGENWAAVNFQSGKVYGLAMDPRDPQTIYASGVWQSRGKIFKSGDQGTVWQEIYTSVSNGTLIITLVMSPQNPDIVYVATSDNQVLQTLDGGHSWKNLYLADSPVVKIAPDYQDAGLLYFNTVSGEVFRSRDGGKTIDDISRNLFTVGNTSGSVRFLETDPNNRNWIYAGGKMGIILSKDAGETWVKISILNNPGNFPVSALAINPLNSAEFIYGSAQASYRTQDSGTTWTTAQFNSGKTVNLIRYGGQNTQNIFLGLSKVNY